MREPTGEANPHEHEPTTHDPLCRCGFPKHNHVAGTGPLAFRHPSGQACSAFERRDISGRPVRDIDESVEREDSSSPHFGKPRNRVVTNA